jgi:hypothetical protein
MKTKRNSQRGKVSPRLAKKQTIARRYKLHFSTILKIRKAAPLYGSQGRALQIACELLSRLASKPKVAENGTAIVPMTFKLVPRTAEQIDTLVDHYGTRADVLNACTAVLDPSFTLRAGPGSGKAAIAAAAHSLR